MREPEFSEQDQAWFLALAEYRALICDSGHWLPDTTTRDAEEAGFLVSRAPTCHACIAVSIKAAADAKDDKHFHLRRYRAEPRRRDAR